MCPSIPSQLHRDYTVSQSLANKMAICVTVLHLHPSFDSQGYHATLSPLLCVSRVK